MFDFYLSGPIHETAAAVVRHVIANARWGAYGPFEEKTYVCLIHRLDDGILYGIDCDPIDRPEYARLKFFVGDHVRIASERLVDKHTYAHVHEILFDMSDYYQIGMPRPDGDRYAIRIRQQTINIIALKEIEPPRYIRTYQLHV